VALFIVARPFCLPPVLFRDVIMGALSAFIKSTRAVPRRIGRFPAGLRLKRKREKRKQEVPQVKDALTSHRTAYARKRRGNPKPKEAGIDILYSPQSSTNHAACGGRGAGEAGARRPVIDLKY